MPLLFYGYLTGDGKRRLYNEHLTSYESSIFDQYKIKHLAPRSERCDLGTHWWIRVRPRHPHTALAWHDELGREQTIFLPGELSWTQTLTTARDIFKPLIPSAITFRLTNYEEPYVYD